MSFHPNLLIISRFRHYSLPSRNVIINSLLQIFGYYLPVLLSFQQCIVLNIKYEREFVPSLLDSKQVFFRNFLYPFFDDLLCYSNFLIIVRYIKKDFERNPYQTYFLQ
jgi:hypothetical protein